ncbi:MAG: ArnT family glycosyltransferase [Myxococcota bacterium]
MTGNVWSAGVSRVRRWVAHPQAGSIALVLVCAFGLAFRLWNVGFGFPYLRHPDEGHNIRHALRIVNERDLNPHFFRYPSGVFYLNALVEIIYFGIARVFGKLTHFSDIQGPIEPIWGSGFAPSVAPFMLGRLLSVAAGVGCVALVFYLVRRLSGRDRDALLAALLTAVSPVCVIQSRYVAPDSITTFFVTLALLFAANVFVHGKLRDYCLAGAAIGLAGFAKYNGAMVALAVTAAHLARPRVFRDVWKLVVAGVISVLAFLITNPYVVLDYKTFKHDLSFGEQRYAQGLVGLEGSAFDFYKDWLLTQEGGMSVFAALFVVLGVLRRSRAWLFLSAFPLAYLIFISRYAIYNDRTLLPVVPLLCAMAAMAFFAILDWVLARSERPWLRRATLLGATVLGAYLVLFPAWRSFDLSLPIGRRDSVDEARDWINANLPAGARVAIEPYAPFVDTGRYLVQGFPTLSQHPASWYAQRFDYLVLSSATYKRYEAQRSRQRRRLNMYASLVKSFKLVKLFADDANVIQILRTQH